MRIKSIWRNRFYFARLNFFGPSFKFLECDGLPMGRDAVEECVRQLRPLIFRKLEGYFFDCGKCHCGPTLP